MPEREFLVGLTRRTGCRLLLNVNDVFVSAYDNRFDAIAYLDAIPPDRVRQIHVAELDRARRIAGHVFTESWHRPGLVA